MSRTVYTLYKGDNKDSVINSP